MGRLKVNTDSKYQHLSPHVLYNILYSFIQGQRPRVCVCKLSGNILEFSIIRETKIKVFSCPPLPLTPTMHLAAEKKNVT